MSHWEPPIVKDLDPRDRLPVMRSKHRILLKIGALLGMAMLLDHLTNG